VGHARRTGDRQRLGLEGLWRHLRSRCVCSQLGWAHYLGADDDEFAESAPASLESLAPALLPLLLPPLLAYTPPSPPLADAPAYPASLLATDLSILTLAVQTLESQTLDTTAWQVALFDRREAFSRLLDFVERAGTPAVLHAAEDEDEDEDVSPEVVEKRFGSLKGGVVKCVVAVFGEDGVGERIFEANEAGELARMRRWLEQEASGEREDMVICAVLSLGNLARSGAKPPRTARTIERRIVADVAAHARNPQRPTALRCSSRLSHFFRLSRRCSSRQPTSKSSTRSLACSRICRSRKPTRGACLRAV
jgi:hypothetical protein